MDAETTVWYSVIRLIPDPLREEFVNVGVILISGESHAIQMLPAVTPVLRALAPPQTRRSLSDLEPWLASQLSEGARLSRLQQLIQDGMSGYGFSQPRRRVMDVRVQSLRTMAANIYRDFVEPRRWKDPYARAHLTRLDTQVKQELQQFDLPRDRVATGLQLHKDSLHFDFPLAFVNGSLNLMQTIDFGVQRDSQLTNLSKAIAHIAEVEKALAPAELSWTNLVRTGEGSYPLQKRLEPFGTTITADRLDEVVRRVRDEATRPIEAYFERMHATVARREGVVHVDVH
jgi:Protein of unknown function (DUF3037)